MATYVTVSQVTLVYIVNMILMNVIVTPVIMELPARME